MTVSQLIAALEKMPPDQAVRVYSDAAADYLEVSAVDSECRWVTIDTEAKA